MAVRLYMDAHVPSAITMGLRQRGVDVLTAQEDGADRLSDLALLDRASALGRVLFTYDRHFRAEAARCQRSNISFSGVVCADFLRISIGACIRDLELIAKLASPDEMRNRLEYLPL
ncbi:MAG: DUF5615 family PIN-like protein [Anaerolineae bacterium]